MAKGRYYTPQPIRHVPGLTYRKGQGTERHDAYEGTPEVLQAAGIAEPHMLPAKTAISWRPEGAHRYPYTAEGYMTITALPGGRYRVYRTVSAEEQAEREREWAARDAAWNAQRREEEQTPEEQHRRRVNALAQGPRDESELRDALDTFTRASRRFLIDGKEFGPYRLAPDAEMLASLCYAFGVIEDAIEKCPVEVNRQLEKEIDTARRAIEARTDPAFQAMLKGLRRRPARRANARGD